MRPVLFLDFDGTITEEDTLVLLLDRFGVLRPDGTDWRGIEFDESLPEKVKLQAELDLLRVSPAEALAWLDGVNRLRAGFDDFLTWTTEEGLEPVILSGGLLPIIERTLARHMDRLHGVHANGLRMDGHRWVAVPPRTPRIRNLCNHCKTWHLREARAQGRPIVYVGDGGTDHCPAREADLVFARGNLAEQMTREGRRHLPFTTFHDVSGLLRHRDWSRTTAESAPRETGLDPDN